MPYVPCRECLTVVPYRVASCDACGAPRPGSASASPSTPKPPSLGWRLPLVLAASLLLVGGCGGSGGASQDPRRQKYEADKARCEQTSQEEPARKSCMVYRGWPDGKFR